MTDPAQSQAAAAAASYASATAAVARGNFKNAFRDSLMALALGPDVDEHRRLALSFLRTTAGYRVLPMAVSDALIGCCTDPTLDLQPLAMVVRETVAREPNFEIIVAGFKDPPQSIENGIDSGVIDWFLNHPLVRATLSRAINISHGLERALTGFRRHALLWHAERGAPSVLVTRYSRFAEAMALQANLAAFPWAEMRDETTALQKLQTDPAAALLVAMYRPVEDQHPDFARLYPQALAAFREQRLAIAAMKSSLPMLTPIDNPTSRIVARQYESYPYPPWDALALPDHAAWQPILKELGHRPEGYPNTAQAPLKFLVAGCGTGQTAVTLASLAPKAAVTAFDLSRASLAHAKLKAEQFVPGRIKFGVGDVLNVMFAGDWFDLIECGGVLHHMASPADGLAALTSVLRPGGRMKLGLYSKQARRPIKVARDRVNELGWRDGPVGMRGARGALLAFPKHPAYSVTDMIDFFSLDAFHDLVFNVVEHAFTPAAIKAALEANGLEFLGFDLPSAALADQNRPKGESALDLIAWHDYEKANPGIFTEMYQFWCRKPVA